MIELTADRTWLLKLMKESDAETRKTLFGGLAQLTGEAGKLWMETVLPFLRGKIGTPGGKESKDAAKSSADSSLQARDAENDAAKGE